MGNEKILSKLNKLPDNLRREAIDFIDFLSEKYEREKKEKPACKSRIFGSSRGLFIIPDDFDEPLEDFKEYM